MKILPTLFIILSSTFLVLLASCDKGSDPVVNKLSVLPTLAGESGMPYDESFSQWTALKNLNGNSYLYQTTVLSWTGAGSTTQLKIEDGIVTSRIYQEFSTDGTSGQKHIIDSYAEARGDLGSHEKGAQPRTIDELYNTCASNYLIVDEQNNAIHFETEKNGLMTLCGFVPDNCEDDCFSGVRIDGFEWIN